MDLFFVLNAWSDKWIDCLKGSTRNHVFQDDKYWYSLKKLQLPKNILKHDFS